MRRGHAFWPFLRLRLRIPSGALAPALLLAASSLTAQLEPPSTGGAVALQHEQRMLGHNRRVLVIGAHPDDEDTELLTVLVRGMGAEAAYLSLNRGEGGQNLIGPELGEALGILRTEELLAARRLDGARQYFTRAYDFGYSKSLDDTWAHWPRDSVLKDVVRIVRRFRPQIIVSIFRGTPGDGHGQHQAAGWVARESFRVAGDATRFPELEREEGLVAWTPLKLYRDTWFDTAATTLVLDGGALDEAVGRSYHQIAMQGRSLHRSQDMGRLQRIGPSAVRVALIEDRTGAGNELFSGIDTALGPVPAAIVTADQLRHRARIEAVRRGILFDAVADDDRVIPGQRSAVRATVAGNAPAGSSIEVVIPGDWSAAPARGSRCASQCDVRSRIDSVVVQAGPTAGAAISTPYFMALPRVGAMYAWPAWARQDWGEAFDRPRLRAELRLGADSLPLEREVTYRYNDQARGEVRRPVTVVPRVDVRVDRDTTLVAVGSARPVRLVVTLTHGARDTTSGRVTIEVPAGWPAVAPQEFRFTREDERESFTFDVRTSPGLAVGSHELRAVAATGGERHSTGVQTLEYPHVRPRPWPRPAVTTVIAAELALPKLTRVGYVRGAADRVPEALVAVGVPVEILDSAALERGDLSRYDAIVIGPRAYETERALAEHNGRLLAYARNGGLVIVQYQQYQFVRQRFAPFPISIADPHDRITDERSPVRIVRPDDPSVTTPNMITARDWNGWVQERGLYFARTWDASYRTVLEARDPGEPPREGGLLIAPLGRGTYVYSGIAFFRQLPAGVPGAFRLFANLLALPRSPAP